MLRFVPAFFLVFLCCSCTSQQGDLPNIIIILVDDLGERDLGCYGQKFIETPHIDQLAKDGAKWNNAYSSCPVCSPSRVAILTGKNPARVHFTGHITRIGRHRYPENARIIPPDDLMDIPLEETILPEALKPLGYTSISIGKWHVGREGFWPIDMGFNKNIAGWTHGMPPSHFYPYQNPEEPWNASIPTLKGGKEGEYLTDRLTEEAIKFITENKNNPFLLYLSHYAVHTPMQAPKHLIDKYEKIVAGSKINPVYAAMVESVDLNVGKLLSAVDKLNLTENTAIILASDNGGLMTVTDNSPYKLGKGHLYEGGIRVPFLIKWPKTIRGGIEVAKPTISTDIFSTVLDIAGIDLEKHGTLDGRSVLHDLQGGNENEDLFWYYPHYAPQTNRPGAAIRSGKYKLIQFYDPPEIELYDLENDLGETTNLIDARPETAKNLLKKLDDWLMETKPIMHEENPDYDPEN